MVVWIKKLYCILIKYRNNRIQPIWKWTAIFFLFTFNHYLDRLHFTSHYYTTRKKLKKGQFFKHLTLICKCLQVKYNIVISHRKNSREVDKTKLHRYDGALPQSIWWAMKPSLHIKKSERGVPGGFCSFFLHYFRAG